MTTLRPGSAEEVERIKNPPKAPEPPAKAAKAAKGKAPPEPEKPPVEAPPTMWLGPVTDSGVQMIYVVNPEPTHEPIDGPPQEQPLAVSAVADRPRYEADVTSLTFKPTAMYQVRGGESRTESGREWWVRGGEREPCTR